ncbi:hypothetical protein IWX49DRAFT_245108 [Phyllosticta citricarpa]
MDRGCRGKEDQSAMAGPLLFTSLHLISDGLRMVGVVLKGVVAARWDLGLFHSPPFLILPKQLNPSHILHYPFTMAASQSFAQHLALKNRCVSPMSSSVDVPASARPKAWKNENCPTAEIDNEIDELCDRIEDRLDLYDNPRENSSDCSNSPKFTTLTFEEKVKKFQTLRNWVKDLQTRYVEKRKENDAKIENLTDALQSRFTTRTARGLARRRARSLDTSLRTRLTPRPSRRPWRAALRRRLSRRPAPRLLSRLFAASSLSRRPAARPLARAPLARPFRARPPPSRLPQARPPPARCPLA